MAAKTSLNLLPTVSPNKLPANYECIVGLLSFATVKAEARIEFGTQGDSSTKPLADGAENSVQQHYRQQLHFNLCLLYRRATVGLKRTLIAGIALGAEDAFRIAWKFAGGFSQAYNPTETSLVEEALNFFGRDVMSSSEKIEGFFPPLIVHVLEVGIFVSSNGHCSILKSPQSLLKSSTDDEGFSLVHNDPLSRLHSET
ncbi:hypothetical protein HO173_005502 [Letharia columbiana]|uniref:Uncharacterized protein n=1 Tax=Letharia columbiana TaxID=112416 RepID=A0A8H6L5I7_9LECA|nr:uncharacterized protein HO173_005502 [Letharia columbiana]KAF6236410.1 hypothetical protein HO173_005502 [Letharia columbiana]